MQLISANAATSWPARDLSQDGVAHITAPANLTVVCVDLNKDGPLGYIVGGILSGTITMRWTAEGLPEGLTMEAKRFASFHKQRRGAAPQNPCQAAGLATSEGSSGAAQPLA